MSKLDFFVLCCVIAIVAHVSMRLVLILVTKLHCYTCICNYGNMFHCSTNVVCLLAHFSGVGGQKGCAGGGWET